MPRNKAPKSSATPQQMASAILYEWWFAIAEQLFERVCLVTELDAEQKEALRTVALRPNDFQIDLGLASAPDPDSDS